MCCLHLKTEFRSCSRGLSVVGHLLLPLMNSFNKTEAAIFPWRLCFLRGFPFISLIIIFPVINCEIKRVCSCSSSDKKTGYAKFHHYFTGTNLIWFLRWNSNVRKSISDAICYNSYSRYVYYLCLCILYGILYHNRHLSRMHFLHSNLYLSKFCAKCSQEVQNLSYLGVMHIFR